MLILLLPSLLVLWLLPCALQDYRQRRVANVLAILAFFAAWPLALWLGGTERVMFNLAVFAGCWLAWGMAVWARRMGRSRRCWRRQIQRH